MLQHFPWRCVHSLDVRLSVAALLGAGAGVMGALMVLKRLSSRSINNFKEEDIKELHVTVPGLQNSGNNCFLNAVLQALASSQKLMNYLKDYPDEGSDGETKLPLSAALSQLLQELSEVGAHQRCISPKNVMSLLARYTKNFDLSSQQDAAEALSHLAEALQKERLQLFDYGKPSHQSFSFRKELENRTILDFWRQQLRWPLEGTLASTLICSECSFQSSMQVQSFKDIPLGPAQTVDGFIVDGCTIEECLRHFTTQEKVSNVKCNRCIHMTAINHMSLLKSETNKNVIKILRSCNCDDNCPCEELVSRRGVVWAKNMRVDAYKCFRLARCPDVLCLHIQRLTCKAGRFEKLMGYVAFPLELDLYPYTMGAPQTNTGSRNVELSLHTTALLNKYMAKCFGGNASSMDQLEGKQELQDQEVRSSGMEANTQAPNGKFEIQEHRQEVLPSVRKQNGKNTYELLSVVVHHGGAFCGHYTVYRRVKLPLRTLPDDDESSVVDEQQDEEDTVWFQISDAEVTRVTEAEVLGARATLLFYEKSSRLGLRWTSK